MEMTVLDALLNDIDLDANDDEAISLAKSIESDLKKMRVIFALFDLLQRTNQKMVINKLIDEHLNPLDKENIMNEYFYNTREKCGDILNDFAKKLSSVVYFDKQIKSYPYVRETEIQTWSGSYIRCRYVQP